MWRWVLSKLGVTAFIHKEAKKAVLADLENGELKIKTSQIILDSSYYEDD